MPGVLRQRRLVREGRARRAVVPLRRLLHGPPLPRQERLRLHRQRRGRRRRVRHLPRAARVDDLRQVYTLVTTYLCC